MGGKNSTSVDGVGHLTYQRAIDIARNTEGDLDPTVHSYLESALSDVWHRISLQPESYVLNRDEFAVFNFYRTRFEGNPVAEQAVDRYWRHNTADSASGRR